MLLYQDRAIFVYGFNHKLGSTQRDLNQLTGRETFGWHGGSSKRTRLSPQLRSRQK